MKKILLVFGTRPEAIKMAPLVKEFQKHSDKFETKVCVTGQHRQMLDQVLEIFDIKPDYDLNIMKPGQDLYDVTSNVLLGIREILKEVKPDIVLVHGDTTTSMATALASYYQHIPVGHVEAGLRTNNIFSPWPEEINRQITGRIAEYNFAPTTLSSENLIKENVPAKKIVITGNTVIDALLWVVNKINSETSLQIKLNEELKKAGYDVTRLDNRHEVTSSHQSNRRLVLITGHRRENFGEGFINICKAIKEFAEGNQDIDLVYPMHLNPNVRKPIQEIFGNSKLENVFFIEPLDYLAFVFLMGKSAVILTDSGGIQEEAPGLGKPVIVMRETTERPEAVDAGTVKLVGTNKEKIKKELQLLLHDSNYYNKMSQAVNPYGDGFASKRIVNSFI